MDKRLKIALIVFGFLLLIGAGVLVYNRKGMYKDKSVRKSEKKFRQFGSILEKASSKYPEIYNWYQDLPQNNISLIEDSFDKLSPEQKDLLVQGFSKPQMNDFTKNLITKLGYKK